MQKPRHLLENTVSIVLFLFVYYAVTSNPVVKPKPDIPEKKWSIEKAQSPLFFGIASHNYLILRDQNGTVINELHGVPTKEDGTFVRVAFTSGHLLKVLEFSTPPYGNAQNYHPSGVIVTSGDKDSMLAKWQDGLSCAKSINAKGLTYPAFGINFEDDTVNSNSVATTLLSCMHLPSPKVGLLTPGYTNLIMK